MPIIAHVLLRQINQAEFRDIAYDVMRCVFEIHNDFGRFFDEKIYKLELARRFPEVALEVPIDIVFESFTKRYFLDMLVRGGALFEFKAVEALTPRHRAQLLNYLLLLELCHGKLVNVRLEKVDHEFVNTSLLRADRIAFDIQASNWDKKASASRFDEILIALLRDLGTGLDLSLYEEALIHFLGGESKVLADVEVFANKHLIGTQRMRLASPGVAFKLTALDSGFDEFALHATQLLHHTRLNAILWANIGLKTVTLTTLK